MLLGVMDPASGMFRSHRRQSSPALATPHPPVPCSQLGFSTF